MTPRRLDWGSRQDCLPFGPPASIIGGEKLKAGKMGFVYRISGGNLGGRCWATSTSQVCLYR